MRSRPGDQFYISRKPKLLQDYDDVATSIEGVLVSHFGAECAERLVGEMRQEFDSLIPQLPNIGGSKNRLMGSFLAAVRFLPLFRVLARHGVSVARAGTILYESAEQYLSAMSWLTKLRLRVYWRLVLTSPGQWMLRREAARSHRRLYSNDFVFSYIKGNGDGFDFGLDFIECAVCSFFETQGAAEFAPFVCLYDFPMSRLYHSGLDRTMTLAEGAPKCDFRYKRGRKIKSGWPPGFLMQ